MFIPSLLAPRFIPRQTLRFAVGRTLSILSVFGSVAILSLPATQVLAQAGGDGTGGSEGHVAQALTGNKNPASIHKSRAKSGKTDRAKRPSQPAGVTLSTGPSGNTLTFGDRGLVALAPASDVEWRIGGRLHLDAGGIGTTSQAVASEFQDTLVRRAFIESYLTLSETLEIAIQYDTAKIDFQPLQDAGVSYRAAGPLMLSVGNFKEPMGFDQLTSDNDTLFLERALPTALTPSRNFGGLAGLNGEQWSLVAGIWGGDPNTGLTDEGLSGTARATVAPILTATQVLHLGISGSYRKLDRRSDQYAFETTATSTPETYLLPFNDALVNTGTISGATAIERLGLESAYQYASFRLQGEANWQSVTRVGSPDVTFRGYYAEFGWVLNGDGRPYRIKPSYGSEYAEFGGVQVADDQRISNRGIGVFEIAARASSIDLSDRDISGGSERDVTIGINWYPERNIKVISNYIAVNATPAMAGGRVQANIFASRLQLYW